MPRLCCRSAVHVRNTGEDITLSTPGITASRPHSRKNTEQGKPEATMLTVRRLCVVDGLDGHDVTIATPTRATTTRLTRRKQSHNGNCYQQNKLFHIAEYLKDLCINIRCMPVLSQTTEKHPDTEEDEGNGEELSHIERHGLFESLLIVLDKLQEEPVRNTMRRKEPKMMPSQLPARRFQ